MTKSRRIKRRSTLKRKRSTRRSTRRSYGQRRTVGAGCSWYDRKCKVREREIEELNNKLELDKQTLQKEIPENSSEEYKHLLRQKQADAREREQRRANLQRMGVQIKTAMYGSTVQQSDEEKKQERLQEARNRAYMESRSKRGLY